MTPPSRCQACIAWRRWPSAGCWARIMGRSPTRTCHRTFTSLVCFNRRRSRSRGLLFFRLVELAIDHPPVRYQDLVDFAKRRVKGVPPKPPQTRGHPPSLERPPANRPWRSAGHLTTPAKWIPLSSVIIHAWDLFTPDDSLDDWRASLLNGTEHRT